MNVLWRALLDGPVDAGVSVQISLASPTVVAVGADMLVRGGGSAHLVDRMGWKGDSVDGR